YNWAITVAFELVAVQFIMKFWFPDIPGFYWSALFLVIIFMNNAMSVKGFGESEFWFSMVKVIAIVAIIIIGTAKIIKVMLTPGVATFGNWT
ncbi:lysine transporter, partial [Acinetobacter baumannii]|nr:lysine transporter [Acinetobacter baumannii]